MDTKKPANMINEINRKSNFFREKFGTVAELMYLLPLLDVYTEGPVRNFVKAKISSPSL
jgi:hypothetical protein